MSLFDSLKNKHSGCPPHLKAMIAKVFGPGTIISREEAPEEREVLTEDNLHLLATPAQLAAERERIVKDWRKSTSSERRKATTARNKKLRAAGLDPTHWSRLVRNHYDAPREVMDEIVEEYRSLPTMDAKNDFSKLVHWTPAAGGVKSKNTGPGFPNYLSRAPGQPKKK